MSYHNHLPLDKSITLRSSNITTPSTLTFTVGSGETVREAIKDLDVYGYGALDFRYYGELTLHDLFIKSGGILRVKNWNPSRHSILVRKSSPYISDSLGRIKFDGYGGRTRLISYDSTYWKLYAVTPEPATYGAALSAAGLTLFLYSRRRRASLARA